MNNGASGGRRISALRPTTCAAVTASARKLSRRRGARLLLSSTYGESSWNSKAGNDSFTLWMVHDALTTATTATSATASGTSHAPCSGYGCPLERVYPA